MSTMTMIMRVTVVSSRRDTSMPIAFAACSLSGLFSSWLACVSGSRIHPVRKHSCRCHYLVHLLFDTQIMKTPQWDWNFLRSGS